MPYRYRNVNTGQVIESAEEVAHLEGVARWEREHIAELSPVGEKPEGADAPDAGQPHVVGEVRGEVQADGSAQAGENAGENPTEQAENDDEGKAPALDADREVWLAYARDRGLTVNDDDELAAIQVAAYDFDVPAGNQSTDAWREFVTAWRIAVADDASRDDMREAATVWRTANFPSSLITPSSESGVKP